MMKYNNYNDFFANININMEEMMNTWSNLRKGKRKIMITSLIIVAIVDIILYAIFKSELAIFPTLMLDLVVFIILYGSQSVSFSGKKEKEANIEYKEKVMNQLLGNFIDELDYVPKKGLPNYIFNEADYGGPYDRYFSEDYAEGKINDEKIALADLVVEREEIERKSDGTVERRTVTVFSGLFTKIELNKSINSNLKIQRHGVVFSRKDKLEMESAELEKKFDVYADNKIIGMQLLTADIQEDIINLYNKYKISFYIYIKNNQMYILFDTNDMFEIFQGNKNPLEILEKNFDVMKFVYNLAEKITKTIDETQI